MAKYVSENGIKAIRDWTKGQDNKSLYNLGAYDTISGNVITRQTGYVNGKDYLSKTISKNGVNNPYLTIDNIYVDYIENVVGNCNRVDTNAWWNVTFSQVTISYDSTYKFLVIMLPNGATDTSSLNNIYIQYKLATSYTEEIIEGQPLITLDQQGSQWLRDEWEKGLNVFDGLIELGSLDTSTGQENQTSNRWRSKNYISVKPNTTYTISGFSGGPLIEYNTNKIFIKNKVVGNNETFTTSSTTYYVRFYSDSNNTDIMLNEGDHPYPYQAYNGEIVHDKDIADLYKQEYNLGYYDTMMENSDGTYTITRQTGYLVLDGVKNKFTNKYGTTNNGLFANYNLKNYALLPSHNDIVADVISNSLKTYTVNTLYNNNIYGISLSSDGTFAIGLTTAITTIDEANAWLMQNPISIQYKLATATTEKVEANHYARYNQRFILDHNKSEAERSCNLLPPSCFYPNNNIQSDGSLGTYDGYSCYYKVPVKPNTTYIASRNGGIISNDLGVAMYDSNGTFLKYVVWSGSKGTTENNVYYISFDFLSSYTNIMLNVGSIALPYQPYEGKVVHEKELGDTLGEKLNSYVDVSSTQVITGEKRFSFIGVDLIKSTSTGEALFTQNATTGDVSVGAVGRTIRFVGNQDRPFYSKDGGVSFRNLALLADIPTFKTINGNSIVGSGDLTITADSVFTEVTDVIDSFIINKNGTWLITCLGYNKIYASDNSTISFYGSALVSMTSVGSDPHICINGTAYACSSAITFVTSGIMQVYKKAN